MADLNDVSNWITQSAIRVGEKDPRTALDYRKLRGEWEAFIVRLAAADATDQSTLRIAQQVVAVWEHQGKGGAVELDDSMARDIRRILQQVYAQLPQRDKMNPPSTYNCPKCRSVLIDKRTGKPLVLGRSATAPVELRPTDRDWSMNYDVGRCEKCPQNFEVVFPDQ